MTLERAEVAITLSIERGFPQLLALGTVLRGWVLAGRQQGMAGITQIHKGLGAWRATGAELLRPYVHGLLAEAYRNVGQTNEGLIVLDEALVTVQETGERWWEALSLSALWQRRGQDDQACGLLAADLWLVHRGIRHGRPSSGQGATRRTIMRFWLS